MYYLNMRSRDRLIIQTSQRIQMNQVKTALQMLKANEPNDTPMPNTDLTLGQYLLSIGIKDEAYYENLFGNK